MQINVKYLSAFYFFISVFIGFSCPILAKDSTLVLFIDAEFGLPNSTSAQAIGLGAQLAINDIEASGLLKDRKLVIERSDNRGVPAIGVDNLSKAAERSDVVAVMGGKFSPVYMEQRPLADQLGMILLDPWGSADGITKMGETANWAFRLSLTDQWAAPAFMDEAKRRSVDRVGAIIPNTAWGRSNLNALRNEAAQQNIQLAAEAIYNWGDKSLAQQYQAMLDAKVGLVILVANENEGALFVRRIANLPKDERIPVLAHAGITGGNFAEMTNGLIENVDLSVIQTFSFYNPLNERAQSLLRRILEETHTADKAGIKSPMGIAQAYDLTWLLALAIAKANSTDRSAIRDALENIDRFDGAIKDYERPFSSVNHNAPLNDQVFFARYSDGADPKPVR